MALTAAVLARPCGQAYDGGPGVLGVLHEQGADTARGGRDQGDGVGAEVGELQDAQCGATGADHGDGFGFVEAGRDPVEPVGVGDGEFGITAGGRAEMGDDAVAEQSGVGGPAEHVDRSGDFPAGDGGQLGGGREGACHALTQGGVQEVHARRGDGDTDLAGAGYGVVGRLVREVLGGAEGVEADGVHGGLPGSTGCRGSASDLNSA